MAWNGAGNFQRTNGSFSGSAIWQDDTNAGFDIVNTRHDTHDQDLAQGINNCLAKDGQNSPTADLPMAGFKHTSVADGSARNQYATVAQLQDQGVQALASVGGTANAITASMTPVISAYVTGARYTFKAISNSSSTVTLKIDSAPAVAVQFNGAALVSGEIAANQWHTVIYDGSVFQLLNPATSASTRTLPASVAQVQDGDYIWLGTTGGTATAQTASAAPAITAYKAGQKFRMKIGTSLGSTGSTATAHTLQLNGISGPKNIVNQDGTNPTLGTWVADAIMEVVYDGTNFIIVNDPGGWLNYTPTLSVAGGGTSGEAVQFAMYRKRGKTIELQIYYTWTQTTATAAYVALTPPVNAATNVQSLGAFGWLSGASVSGIAYFNPVSSINIYNYNNGAFAVGAASVLVNGIYKSV